MAFLALWLGFNLYQTISHIVHYYMPLPIWDYWRVVENLGDYQHFRIATLWRQHNEHRIIFPELVYAADMLWVHGRQILPLVVSFLSYFCLWLVFSWTILEDTSLPTLHRIPGALLAGVIMFWPGSAMLLALPFLLQWSLLLVTVALSLLSLGLARNSSNNIAFFTSIACASVATYSSGNGLCLWPLLLLAGLLLQLDWRKMMVLAISAVVIVGLYFVGYKFSHELNLRNVLTHPVYSLEFIGAYLGVPFSFIKFPEFGVLIGLAGLALAISSAVTAARKRLFVSPSAVLLLGFYLFVVLTAAITAAGRMNADDPLFGAAKPVRYVIVPLAAWGALILLLFWMAIRERWRFAQPLLLASIITLLFLLSLPKMRVWLASNANDFAEQQVAALSIEDGLSDSTLMRKVFPDVAYLTVLESRLRQEHLSSWYRGRDRWFGQPVERYGRIRQERLPGQVTSVYPLESGIQVTGWVDDSDLRGPYRWIVLADQARNIVGFGKRIPAGYPWSLKNVKTPTSLGWVGFISLRGNPTAFSAYVVDPRRGGLFPLEGPVPVPDVRNIQPADAGPTLTNLRWTDDLKWHKSAVPEKVDFGPAPTAPVHSSWNGADGNFGQIASTPFAAPANGCIVMPILHGPSVDGLSVSLLDGQTGSTLLKVPLRDIDLTWRFWKIPVPRSAKTLRIVARDQGAGWGQWLAVSDPLACR